MLRRDPSAGHAGDEPFSDPRLGELGLAETSAAAQRHEAMAMESRIGGDLAGVQLPD
jgi:hypothetical protein